MFVVRPSSYHDVHGGRSDVSTEGAPCSHPGLSLKSFPGLTALIARLQPSPGDLSSGDNSPPPRPGRLSCTAMPDCVYNILHNRLPVNTVVIAELCGRVFNSLFSGGNFFSEFF